jgi:hypothetical protein
LSAGLGIRAELPWLRDLPIDLPVCPRGSVALRPQTPQVMVKDPWRSLAGHTPGH